MPPQAFARHMVCETVSHECGVTAAEIELASQMSISAQHEPWPPTPVLTLLEEGTHPSTLPCTSCQDIVISPRISALTHLAVDPFQITRALGITIADTILGSSFVIWVSSNSTICGHAGEVEGSIETTWKPRHIDVEGEFFVEEVECLGHRLASGDSLAFNLGARAFKTSLESFLQEATLVKPLDVCLASPSSIGTMNLGC